MLNKLFTRITNFLDIGIIKTLIFNFRYFEFRQAVKIPVLLSRRVVLHRIGGKVSIEGPVWNRMIRIGFGHITIFDRRYSRVVWDVEGNVIFHGKTHLGHGAKIQVGKAGLLTFGKNFRLNAESEIMCRRKITFGDNNILSWRITVMDSDFHPVRDLEGNTINPEKEIVVGNDVWIGCECMLMKGAKVGDGCVVGARTLVTGPIEGTRLVIVGNPARVVKKDIDWGGPERERRSDLGENVIARIEGNEWRN